MAIPAQELAALLHEPLQPKYSQRFFAGQPSAALAAQAADASSQPKDTINSQAVSQVNLLDESVLTCSHQGRLM